MKTQIKSGIFGLFVAITCLSCETKMPLSTVKYVDLGRYSGTWYEIASYPQFFPVFSIGTPYEKLTIL